MWNKFTNEDFGITKEQYEKFLNFSPLIFREKEKKY